MTLSRDICAALSLAANLFGVYTDDTRHHRPAMARDMTKGEGKNRRRDKKKASCGVREAIYNPAHYRCLFVLT